MQTDQFSTKRQGPEICRLYQIIYSWLKKMLTKKANLNEKLHVPLTINILQFLFGHGPSCDCLKLQLLAISNYITGLLHINLNFTYSQSLLKASFRGT